MNDPLEHVWGDSLDITAVYVFFAVVIGLPALGFFFAVVDVRRYLRSLRRAISTLVLRDYSVPEWARPKVPRCLVVFGLGWPCTKDELLRAYRDKIKTHHPDHGGDQRRFMALQAHFEEAMQMVRQREEAGGQLGEG
jgi:hypothetical protein